MPSQQCWRLDSVCVGGCGPSALEPPWGPQALKSRAFLAGGLAKGQRVFHLIPSVDCPWGPGLRGTAQRFQNGIRSAAAAGRKRRGGKGRRPSLLGCFALGACLFLSLLRVRQPQ